MPQRRKKISYAIARARSNKSHRVTLSADNWWLVRRVETHLDQIRRTNTLEPIALTLISLLRGGPIGLQLRAFISIPCFILKGSLVDPRVRALREHRRSSGSIPSSPFPFLFPQERKMVCAGRLGWALLRAWNEHRFTVRVLRARSPPSRPAYYYTVKYCFTFSALNSSLLPDTTTAPLAITTYFSARRAAKWSPCSTNKIANRR